MNEQRWTKADLYKNVDILMSYLKGTHDCEFSAIDSKKLAIIHCRSLHIEILDFLETRICAILDSGRTGTSIALNKLRNEQMQNFDCMHELIHYYFHPGQSFHSICSENGSIIQNPIQEWQANEGAAQALVPYQVFIPEYVSRMKSCSRNEWNTIIIHNDLAELFNVTTVVIRNRINSLKYEIYQYLRGVPLSDIVILSKKQLERRGLNKLIEHRTYCTHCHAVVDMDNDYCTVCGSDFDEQIDWLEQKTYSGVDYMVHQGIDIDENSRAIRCPVCDNEEIDAQYCKICGSLIINYCTNDDNCHNHSPLAGNARFCHSCGSKSTFYQYGYLNAWDDPVDEIPY